MFTGLTYTSTVHSLALYPPTPSPLVVLRMRLITRMLRRRYNHARCCIEATCCVDTTT